MIDFDRLLERVEALAAVAGSQTRIALSDADKAGRDLVQGWMIEAGLKVEIDQIGNIFGTRAGTEDCAPVMTGSHIDTVGNPGKLDGMLGVLGGLEVIESFKDQGVRTARPLTVAIFTNEEGVRYAPDMIGSLVHAGGHDLGNALKSVGTDGTIFGEELQRIGYAGDMPCGTITPHAFIELHIEQGPVLYSEGLVIGAVEDLQGISWQEITIKGEANHAGTTPMHLRHDAGFAAAQITTYVRQICDELAGNQVGTVGTIHLKPDLTNVIAAEAILRVDLRNTDNDALYQAESLLQNFIEKLAAAEGVSIHSNQLVRFDPVTFSGEIVGVICAAADELGISARRMTSGAGHDAQMMARVTKSAMIFVPSIDGISHNPAEATAAEHLELGVNVLAKTMLKLAS